MFSWANMAYLNTPSSPRLVTIEAISREVLKQYEGKEIQILAPMVRGRKGEFQSLFREVLKKGFSRARIDGVFHGLKPD